MSLVLQGLATRTSWPHLDPSETVVIEHYENGARGTQEDPAIFDLVAFPNSAPKAVL
jgi:hypothetical protein